MSKKRILVLIEIPILTACLWQSGPGPRPAKGLAGGGAERSVLVVLLGWTAGPRNSMKNSGSAGGLAAGDLPGFPELRGGFSTPVKMPVLGKAPPATKGDSLSYSRRQLPAFDPVIPSLQGRPYGEGR